MAGAGSCRLLAATLAAAAAALAPPQGARSSTAAVGALAWAPGEVAAQEVAAVAGYVAAAKELERNATASGKPLMKPMESFRIMMCWGRPRLLEHERCMAFMAKKCLVGRTNMGYCHRTLEFAEKECKAGKERACIFASALRGGHGSATPGNATVNRAVAPAPAPAALGPDVAPAPGPAPVANNASEGESATEGNQTGGLPEQGYNEHSQVWVRHEDMKSRTDDWRAEWPMWHETEGQSIERLCLANPRLLWCKLYLRDRARRGKGPPIQLPLTAPALPAAARTAGMLAF